MPFDFVSFEKGERNMGGILFFEVACCSKSLNAYLLLLYIVLIIVHYVFIMLNGEESLLHSSFDPRVCPTWTIEPCFWFFFLISLSIKQEEFPALPVIWPPMDQLTYWVSLHVNYKDLDGWIWKWTAFPAHLLEIREGV